VSWHRHSKTERKTRARMRVVTGKEPERLVSKISWQGTRAEIGQGTGKGTCEEVGQVSGRAG